MQIPRRDGELGYITTGGNHGYGGADAMVTEPMETLVTTIVVMGTMETDFHGNQEPKTRQPTCLITHFFVTLYTNVFEMQFISRTMLFN